MAKNTKDEQAEQDELAAKEQSEKEKAKVEDKTAGKVSTKIENEKQAVEFVKKSYRVPPNIKVVYVTEDRQVFYRRNDAANYASTTNVKLFAIKWD